MSIFRKKTKEILAPTGSYHKMDLFMLEDNPHPYLKIVREVDHKEIAKKISFWKRFCRILFFPLFK